MRESVIETLDKIAIGLIAISTVVCGVIGAFVDGGSMWLLTLPLGALAGFVVSAFVFGSWLALSGIYLNTRLPGPSDYKMQCIIRDAIDSSKLGRKVDDERRR